MSAAPTQTAKEVAEIPSVAKVQTLANPETGAIPIVLGTKVLAAGAVVWRINKSELEVLLVNQASYKAWSIPKGKLDEGELFTKAAVREVKEETGYLIRLGRPMPSRTYRVATGEKTVRYWAAKVERKVAKGPKNPKEILDVKWFPIAKAKKKAGRAGDRELLTLLERWYLDGDLETHSLALLHPAETKNPAAEKALHAGLKAFGTLDLVAGSGKRNAQALNKFGKKEGLDFRQLAKAETVEPNPVNENLNAEFAKAMIGKTNMVFAVKGSEYKQLLRIARKSTHGYAKARLQKTRLKQFGIKSLLVHVNQKGRVVAAERLPK